MVLTCARLTILLTNFFRIYLIFFWKIFLTFNSFSFFLGLDGFDVRKIDDIEYTVEISCYFLTKWRDDRLLLHEDILKGPFFNYVDKSFLAKYLVKPISTRGGASPGFSDLATAMSVYPRLTLTKKLLYF